MNFLKFNDKLRFLALQKLKSYELKFERVNLEDWDILNLNWSVISKILNFFIYLALKITPDSIKNEKFIKLTFISLLYQYLFWIKIVFEWESFDVFKFKKLECDYFWYVIEKEL